MVWFSSRSLDVLRMFLPFSQNRADFLRLVVFDRLLNLMHFTYFELATKFSSFDVSIVIKALFLRVSVTSDQAGEVWAGTPTEGGLEKWSPPLPKMLLLQMIILNNYFRKAWGFTDCDCLIFDKLNSWKNCKCLFCHKLVKYEQVRPRKGA